MLVHSAFVNMHGFDPDSRTKMTLAGEGTSCPRVVRSLQQVMTTITPFGPSSELLPSSYSSPEDALCSVTHVSFKTQPTRPQAVSEKYTN